MPVPPIEIFTSNLYKKYGIIEDMSYDRLKSIVGLNCFASGNLTEHTSLFAFKSFLNHKKDDSSRTVLYDKIGSNVVVGTAARDLAPGEQLFIDYVGNIDEATERESKLKHWGINNE